MERSERDGPGALELLVTGASAAIYKTVVGPIDRVKLLVQLQSELPRLGRPTCSITHAAAASSPHKNPLFMIRDHTPTGANERLVWQLRNRLVPRSLDFAFNGSAVNATTMVLRSEGVSGLFRGNSISVTMAFISAPLQLYCVSPLHRGIVDRVFHSPDPSRNPMTFVVAQTTAALGSGAVSAAMVYPVEVARIAIAGDLRGSSGAAQFEYANLRAVAAAVKRHEFSTSSGARAHELGLTRAAPYACLYRGLWLGFLGQVAYRTAFWGLYETTGYLRGSEKFTALQEFCLSYVLTGSATLLLYPLDTIRKCYMRAGLSRRAALIEHEMASRGVTTAAEARLHVNPDVGAGIAYRNVGECITRIWETEGPVGFYRGAALLPIRGLAITAAAFALPRLFGAWTLA